MTWQAGSMAVVLAAVAAGFAWYERGRPSSKLVAMVATLAALAVAGRVLFVAVPNVQATTDIVFLSGYVLGAAPGFAVGAVGALASNVFLGQGPWTPWQMLGWGGAGVAGALLARAAGRRLGRRSLAVACALAGLAFGAWMDLSTLMNFAAERTSRGYFALATASLPFNLAHAAGNAALCLLFGPAFVRMLSRFRRRFEVRWLPRRARVPARAGSGAAVAVCALAVLGSVAPAPAQAAGRASAAVRYLERAQNGDGGFGAAPGQPSSQLMTGWAMLGLEAGGRHPLDVRRRGRTPIGFMRANARELNDTGELERTILALRGAGLSVRRFAGRNLAAELLARRRADGSFGGQVNWTAFGILALRAARRSQRSRPVRTAAAWLRRQQNADGGFAFADRGGASDVDDTGAALQALSASGRRRAVRRPALAYLRGAQNPDGGFGQMEGDRSNSQSTAWAVQGIVAAGRNPRSFRRRASRSPLAYLASLQRADGSFRYSRTSNQTPVWVTGQAVAALRLKAYPLRPAKRARRRTRGAPAAAAVEGGPAAGGASGARSRRAGGGGGGAGLTGRGGRARRAGAPNAAVGGQHQRATDERAVRRAAKQSDGAVGREAGGPAVLPLAGFGAAGLIVLGAAWAVRRRLRVLSGLLRRRALRSGVDD